jgi:sugar phosphate permease
LISPLFDRFSARCFMIAGSLFTVAGLFAYRSMGAWIHLVIIYIVLALSQVCAGQVPTILIVTRWFRRYRGIAIGITLIGTSIGGAVFPLVFREVMASGGWRDAVSVFMIISAVMMLLPTIFLIRSRPEDRGLLPDAESAKTETNDSVSKQDQHDGPTLSKALRNPAFYILAVTTGSLWFTMNGIYNHQSFFFNLELGLSVNTYALIASAIFWFAIAGKFFFGYLSDRFDKILMMVIVVVLLIIGLVFLRLSSAGNLLSLYAYAAVFGLGFGGTFTMIQRVIAEFFAGRSYGRILGILTSVDVACAGISVTIIAKMHTEYQSYFPIIEILIAGGCVVAVMVAFLYRIRRTQSRESGIATAAGN